jgi:hypothetical protein
MPNDMEVYYEYNQNMNIKISVNQTSGKNILYFDLSVDMQELLRNINKLPFPLSIDLIDNLRLQLSEAFGIEDRRQTIYIPAGRSTITTLSDQINYIYSSFDEQQKRSIDYCIQKFIQLIIKVKPYFADYVISDKSSALLVELNDLSNIILRANYRFKDNTERLYYNEVGGYTKINLASSGQQEAVWITNLLQYFTSEKINVFLIVEEPEAHLYPDSQMNIADFISLFTNSDGNACIITTHSPYILGELNNLILCAQAAPENTEKAKAVIDQRAWLNRDDLNAYFIRDGIAEDAISETGLIKNELIDGASMVINERGDRII